METQRDMGTDNERGVERGGIETKDLSMGRGTQSMCGGGGGELTLTVSYAILTPCILEAYTGRWTTL
jgi:hypothetical protein